MSKQIDWFVIQKNEHLGPFSEGELKKLLEIGEISGNTLVWQEGWETGSSYNEVFSEDLAAGFQSLSDISETVEVEDSPPPFNTVTSRSDIEDTPPPLPFDLRSLNPKIEHEELGSVESSSPKEPSKRKYRWITFILLVSIGLVAAQYFLNKKDKFSRPSGMSLNDYRKLINVANDQGGAAKFAFALSRDKRKIWISTNSFLFGEMHFNFIGHDKNTLGNGEVEISGHTYLEHHLMVVEDFQFIRGTKFLDGLYDVTLSSNGKLNAPLLNEAFGVFEKTISFKDQVLVSNLSREKFDARLKQLHEDKQKNESEFFETLIEEYRTVQTITNQILSGLRNIFSAAGEGKYEEALANFEDEYKKNFGVFFTSFVISIDKKYELINKRDFEDKTEVIAHYSKLKRLALKIGGESIQKMETLSKANLGKLNPDEIRELEFRTSLSYKEIILECQQMIESLRG